MSNQIQNLIKSNRVVLLKDIEQKIYTIGNNVLWNLPDFVFHGEMSVSDIMVFLHEFTLSLNHEREILSEPELNTFMMTINVGDAKYLITVIKNETTADDLIESSKAPEAYTGDFNKAILNVCVVMEKGSASGVM